MLHILVGPAGAGKTTFCQSKEDWKGKIVSSDAVREEMTGDFQNHTADLLVWNYIHAFVQLRLDHRLDVVVDATNIRDKGRKALLSLSRSPWAKITYHIIDRPLEQKLRDGGWRLEVMKGAQNLIERHHEIFQSNLREILKGDGDIRVSVVDHRTPKE